MTPYFSHIMKLLSTTRSGRYQNRLHLPGCADHLPSTPSLHHRRIIRIGRGGGVSSRSTGSTYSTYFLPILHTCHYPPTESMIFLYFRDFSYFLYFSVALIGFRTIDGDIADVPVPGHHLGDLFPDLSPTSAFQTSASLTLRSTLWIVI